MDKRRVQFSFFVLYSIKESEDLKRYRQPYWEFVRLYRLRLEKKISEILENEHRERIKKQNGL